MTQSNPIKILVADDHALFREGLTSVLNNHPDFTVVGEANDGLEAFIKTKQLNPDVVLMDISMPGTNGLEGAKMIHAQMPETKIVMLTVREEPERIFEAIRNGAQGYLIKNIRATELVEMVKSAARGEVALTPEIASMLLEEFRSGGAGKSDGEISADSISTEATQLLDTLTRREQEILTLIMANLSDKEIASELFISLYTVKSHVRNILSKLHVKNRREAARLAKRNSL